MKVLILQSIVALLEYYSALIRSCRRFGTTYRSHLQGLSISLNMGLIGCPKTSVTINQRCVTSPKSEDLIYIAAET